MDIKEVEGIILKYCKRYALKILQDIDNQLEQEGAFDKGVAKAQRVIRDKIKEISNG